MQALNPDTIVTLASVEAKPSISMGTAAVAVDLTVEIVKNMLGDSISKVPEVDIIELATATVGSNLKIG